MPSSIRWDRCEGKTRRGEKVRGEKERVRGRRYGYYNSEGGNKVSSGT